MSIPFQPAALAGSIAFALGFSSSVHAAEQKVAQAALEPIKETQTKLAKNNSNAPAPNTLIKPTTL